MARPQPKIRRLPGFRFEAQTPARADVLPRMDVAFFVGFAATGPLGTPVAVESAEQFERVFGRDLALVRDAATGATVSAYLAPAVRAFFRNGGRRAWVLRTARVDRDENYPLNRAAANFFPLAGCAVLAADGRLSPAFARARARGSWSDALRVGTAVLAQSLRFLSLGAEDGRPVVELEVPFGETVARGDLLRLVLDERSELLLAADRIELAGAPSSPPAAARVLKVSGARFLRRESLPVIASPALDEPVEVACWTHRADAFAADWRRVHPAGLRLIAAGDDRSESKVALLFKDRPPAPAPGEMLVTELFSRRLALQVEDVKTSDAAGTVEVVARGAFCETTAPFRVSPPAGSPTLERLTFECRVKRGENALDRLTDLAFNAPHPGFWGNLPTDERLYRLTDEADADLPELFDWTKSGAAAVFPLAGAGGRDAFCFPLFPTAAPADFLGAVGVSGSRLERDGLAVFDETLFLDADLRANGLFNLLNEAEYLRYLSPRPRPLRGVHAALAPETATRLAPAGDPAAPAHTTLSLEEATLICVPDAVHRGWTRASEAETIETLPASAPPLRPEWWTFEDCRTRRPRAVSAPLWGNFLACATRVVEAPENLRVREATIAAGRFTLEWDYAGAPDAALVFVLEESTTRDFQPVEEIHRGAGNGFAVFGRAAGAAFYRVRAEIDGHQSDFSNGLALKIPAAESWLSLDVEDYRADVLLAVQRALLRMCAARGDLFAVLELPAHFEREAAAAHVATLKATKGAAAATRGVEPLSADEARAALSFGAVYHPWLLTLEESSATVRVVPPSGAIGGAAARRAFERGAWVAPANELLQGALGLAKIFPRESYLDFQDAFINLVRSEPDGFKTLGADTLSDEPELREINVRRLLSLLRRLALKHGAEYVFEPHDARFRRQVERGFTGLLELLFARGAFAGATPAASFRVSADDRTNGFESVEQGRFIVELRVAPSRPLQFVTVRLRQTGARGTVTESF